ncbi:MAG: SCO family protein [Bacteroidales bacterium]|jgi:protein SCO1/2|nr:SCO family protein [Bacteroidales bacterium]
MKKWIIFTSITTVFLFHSGIGGLQAQVIDPEVGVVEHLDTVIPAGLTFNNEQNQPVQLKSLITKPTILVLIYYDCPGICPMILSSVSDVIETMGMKMGKDYQVVTVSFNDNDTPARAVEKKTNYLRKYSKQHASDWYWLTGDSTNIYGLTHAVGFNFTRAGNDFIHPSLITILSPEGKVTRYLYGTSFLPFDVKMALIEARKGQSRPTINRVLEYCFSYDPEGRRYTLQVTKISATLIIFIAAALFLVLIIRSSCKKQISKTP